ncbi:xanthine dehydrogenase family protein molybdopterin-binding subunit [Oscillatoria sp. FACHB-1407]|uniref:xanthine dehydrogenase family protein molybdopterin-binding subunit n=1 Tax=Oscillatoria sp. FACHB-1407 TaxID=2692847 RepID=UPI0016867BC1|nr:xanthine dehydrogenase family protein molybdopterin-binding subunit [Oscillatoria sp. FACHB-1407]MBD2461248.1 xanthine dehydrogenase family protein molybdopterin-binding subunit [Oscillatoria sp. FACHB-1407]
MSSIIGTAVSRKDGLAKVTGTATYTAEQRLPGLVHGYLVTAAIAKGRVRSLATQAAERSPGVIAVITHQNAPKVFPVTNDFATSKLYESRPPLSDDQIHYSGQIIGLVVADTFERAREAAQLIQVEYDVERAIADFAQGSFQAVENLEFQKGEPVPASESPTLEATYTTATELHAMMEPHAIIAHWQNDSLTVYEGCQWVAAVQRTYAELFGIPTEKVRIVTPFIGGGFGSKAFPWSHSVLCAAVARQIQRPLKLVVSRRQMTANTGHRSETEQTIRLTAEADGTLVAIAHTAKSVTSPVEAFTEHCTNITPVMYAAPHVHTSQTVATLNIGTPTWMRGPGEVPGMWALESAMDELAWQLNLDPIELRLKNETQTNLRNDLPFSSKHFADCLQEGAKRFGWENRPSRPRSLTRDGQRIGWGMAASTFPSYRGRASVKVRLLPDGRVNVLTSANDMGTGAYTLVAIMVAETLGISVDNITVEIGDSLFPDGGLAGGSQMTASLMPAVQQACQNLLNSGNFATVADALRELQRTGRAALEATGSAAPGEEGKQWAFQSWGAHFCEVAIDEELGRLRVTRWVAVMDVGRVMNAKAAASQIRGGVIMGIGGALMEECLFDPNLGHPVVYDLATYHYPSHADIPRIEVVFVGKPDLAFNPLGARGAGEIGITGVAAAIANAIYHATGKRIRSLPITPDKLMA